jgi:site-specific DNA-methyltransferase (adenine-specific)
VEVGEPVSVSLLQGDCVDQMATLDAESIDAVVCDPPYGLEFMGKDWDDLSGGAVINDPSEVGGFQDGDGGNPFSRSRIRYGGVKNAQRGMKKGPKSILSSPGFDLSLQSQHSMQEWHRAWAEQAYRVLKPGGYLCAFGGSRTYHRLAAGMEDAGFVIEGCGLWVYGSGFPKSLNVAKAMDAKAKTGSSRKNGFHQLEGERYGGRIGMYDTVGEHGFREKNPEQHGAFAHSPETPEAQQWEGWGTALKPSWEPVVIGRKA